MKKTIFFLVNDLSFLISHRIELVLASKQKGYKVKVGYGELGNANISVFLKKNIECIHLPLKRKSKNPFFELWSLYSIFKVFNKLKPDIVHLITIKPYLYGAIAARLAKVPSVVSAIAGLGILFNQNRLWNILFQKLLYPFFYLAFKHPNQTIIVQNLGDKKKLIKWLGLTEKKIVLIKGSGVNLSKFTKLKDPKGIVTICFASRLLKHKGIYDFISAAEILRKRGLKANFILAGNIDTGNSTSITKKELNDIINQDLVKVLGYQKDITKLFSKSHIVCLPSFYGEGLPKTLIEAAAAGRAIVTTDVSGCRDAIVPNKTGLLVPVKDPQKLSDKLQWLIEYPQKRIAMGKAARKHAEKEFPIENIVKQHLKIYSNLLKNN